MTIKLRSARLCCLLISLLGCRRDDAPHEQPAKIVGERAPEPTRTSAYLDGALLEARYDSTALAELGRTLPRPTATGSPLVAVFSSIVEQLRGDPRERLAAVGLRADAVIELSVRPLDGRAASARKLLGELASDAEPDPTLVARLRSEAGTLGLHLRASLPIADRTRLLATLAQIIGDSDQWAPTCATLAEVALCSGRERVLVWARAADDEQLRVDALYLFHAGAEQRELAWIARRADEWAAAEPELTGASTHALELVVRAEPTLALLEAEALADAVARFTAVGGREPLDYHAYLDQEQALRDLVPDARVWDGLGIGVDIDAGLRVQTRWLPSEQPAVALTELFAPPSERFDVPAVDETCAAAPACMRLAGLTLSSRFVPLAHGPFADATGAARVLRQAGDRGPILLLLSSWPHLLGTAGRVAETERGLLAEAQAALIEQSYAVGGVLLELGSDSDADRWVAYLRVGPEALAAARPLATMAGIGPRPIELEGVAALVDRGRYESDGETTLVYLVDERELANGGGGWLLAADADARASWLLGRPREASTALTTLGDLQIRELGRLAARESVAFADDPPVQAWLAGQRLTLELRLAPEGPIVDLRLRPR